MAWHDNCEQGRLLLDGYIIALTNEDAARRAVRSGDVTAREARAAQESVVAARQEYWRHVERHRCRTAIS